MPRRATLLRIVAASAIASLAVGCGAENAAVEDLEADLADALSAEGSYDVELDPDSEIVRVERDDGTILVQGDGQPRPDFLREDVPLPSDLEIELSTSIGAFVRVTGVTSSDGDALRAFYGSAADRGGWTVDPEPEAFADEEVVVLAYLHDGVPLDVRLDGPTFDLFVGRRWEPADDD